MSFQIQYLFIELHQRPSQLVYFPCAGPGCLAAQTMVENWLQVRRVDSLQLLPVRVAKGRVKNKKDMRTKRGIPPN